MKVCRKAFDVLCAIDCVGWHGDNFQIKVRVA